MLCVSSEEAEAGAEASAYDTSDITSGLSDSQAANDSRIDSSSADITIDSVRDHM